MSASQFASFAAYTPPPDEHDQPSTSGTSKPSSSWLHFHPPENSYQSGGIPTLHPDALSGSGAIPAEQLTQSRWETRYGWRVDVLAACAYILGPISGWLIYHLLLPMLSAPKLSFFLSSRRTMIMSASTTAYQSALVTMPLLIFRFLLSLAQFHGWLRSLCTVSILFLQCYLSFRAYRDGSDHNLSLFYVPFVGKLAEKWLEEE